MCRQCRGRFIFLIFFWEYKGGLSILDNIYEVRVIKLYGFALNNALNRDACHLGWPLMIGFGINNYRK